ncbi:MAG TPA: glycosyltransferase [Terriglobales bacterium]|jgi:cellulose synthase/poly-beta-1,6-N-acetylglucosamine synthase-like glycosyltransferase
MNTWLSLALQIVFWTSFALVVYTYAGYPLLLFVASSAVELGGAWRRLLGNAPAERTSVESALPGVSILVAAHNEEGELPGLIESLRRLDYPRDRLELVIASDGSTDGTDACLERLREPWIQVHRLPSQQGKASALNAAVALARFPLLLLLDASTRPQPDTARMLLRHFADPRVGVVCGALRFAHHAESQRTEGTYWAYECLLRLMEGRLRATLTASGALYAVRRECFPRLSSTTWIEDFIVPMHARRAGFGVVYDPDAWAWEVPAPSLRGEFQRRVRLAVGSFRALGALLGTRLDGCTRWAFVSHKLLRWCVPFFLVLGLVTNLALWPLPFYRGVLMAQAATYGLAWLGGSGLPLAHRFRLAQGLYFFLAMNAAFLWGFVVFLRDRGQTAWQQVR